MHNCIHFVVILTPIMIERLQLTFEDSLCHINIYDRYVVTYKGAVTL